MIAKCPTFNMWHHSLSMEFALDSSIQFIIFFNLKTRNYILHYHFLAYSFHIEGAVATFCISI